MSLPSGETRLGRLLRIPLRLIPREARMRILAGPSKGLAWIAGAGPHGIWLGRYERRMQQALAALLKPGDTFYDIGANAGLFTILAARLVGPAGHVVAFEPLPSNVELLRAHIAINRVSTATVIEAAVSCREGVSRFDSSASRFTARLVGSGDLEVRVVRLDDCVSTGGMRPPDVIKMDIEGGEAPALEGAQHLLERLQPPILLATHGPECLGSCRALLQALGYRLEHLSGDLESGCCELLAVGSRGCLLGAR